ncbi:trypsin-like peptidase domain-containing protein [Candidatus Uhrbacteria bacterium]|nr:trypsin-like peptidase domain-containing protein [Candidatus Uhrbacteria bacterium]
MSIISKRLLAELSIVIAAALFFWNAPLVSALDTAAAPMIAAIQKKIATLEKTIGALNTRLTRVERALVRVSTPQRPEGVDEQIPQIIAKTLPSVVSIIGEKDVLDVEIVCREERAGRSGFSIQICSPQAKNSTRIQNISAGTGFIVTSDGKVITNKHVISDASARYVVILSDGTKKTGHVLYRDPSDDIALLAIDGGPYVPTKLGNSNAIQLGQRTVAIGNALGQFQNSISSGIISGLGRTIVASVGSAGDTETLSDVIQTDAAINPGNSGGPLLDLSGEAVGVNVAMVQGSQNIGFAIPINRIRQAIRAATGFLLL